MTNINEVSYLMLVSEWDNNLHKVQMISDEIENMFDSYWGFVLMNKIYCEIT